MFALTEMLPYFTWRASATLLAGPPYGKLVSADARRGVLIVQSSNSSDTWLVTSDNTSLILTPQLIVRINETLVMDWQHYGVLPTLEWWFAQTAGQIVEPVVTTEVYWQPPPED